MLVSHRHEFIYTKTKKTASTSVEVFFERFCMPEDDWTFEHLREQHVGPDGIIGARGPAARQSTWYNHMPATDIKAKLGNELWNEYYKFTTIRNPFDKIVSYFHHNEHDVHRRDWSELDSLEERLEHVLWHLRAPRSLEPPSRFRRWVRSEQWLDLLPTYPGFADDRDTYMIDGEVCIDDFVRFEHLQTEVEGICDTLDVPFDPDALPRLKSGRRPDGYTYDDYYDPETADIVADRYRWELDRFGYERPSGA